MIATMLHGTRLLGALTLLGSTLCAQGTPLPDDMTIAFSPRLAPHAASMKVELTSSPPSSARLCCTA